MIRTPRLDRRQLLAGGIAVVFSSLAGCSDGPQPGTRDPVANIPAGASVLVDADAALVDHEGTRRLLGSLGGNAEDDLVTTFETKTGLTADGADSVLLFADAPGSRERAVVVDGEWSESAVVDALKSARGTTFESADHEGGTVYEPAGDGGTTTDTPEAENATDEANGSNATNATNNGNGGSASGGDGDPLLTVESLGVVADGRYVFGDGASVRAAIETAYGEATAVGGDLVEAFEGAGVDFDGATYVTAATDAPRAYLPADDDVRLPPGVSLDLYEKAETANAAYAADGSRVALDATLHVVDEDAAVRIEDLTVTGLVFLRNAAGEAVAAELEKVSVERDGTVVTVSYRSDVEGATTLVEWVA